METIRTENRDGVAVVTLNRGTTNAINRQLVDELTDTLRQLKNDTQVRGAVLVSSNEKFFSIGLDIPQLFELSRDDFGAFYRAFNRLCIDLYTLPKPLVAAITGHATAGGCILALCCDYRFIAQGRKLMGMNEIKLGVPVPYPIDCIFRQLVGVRIAREVVDSGEFYPPDELIGMGMVDQVLPLEQVLPKSIDKVRLLGSYPQEAVEMIKRNRTETVEAEILERLKEREEFFIECWYSDEVRRRLKEAMEKF
ncbi:MAG: enoyl-CoA hydratase/isomerase family protein [Candidatus Zixiibacteriota bacterium]